MTATDVLRGAGEAGLVITVGAKSLEVRGPEAAKAQYLPLVAQNAREIRRLVLAGGLQALPRCSGRCQGVVCPACGYIHGLLADRPSCSGCGGNTWTTSVVSMGGDRLCFGCFTGGHASRKAAAG